MSYLKISLIYLFLLSQSNLCFSIEDTTDDFQNIKQYNKCLDKALKNFIENNKNYKNSNTDKNILKIVSQCEKFISTDPISLEQIKDEMYSKTGLVSCIEKYIFRVESENGIDSTLNYLALFYTCTKLDTRFSNNSYSQNVKIVKETYLDVFHETFENLSKIKELAEVISELKNTILTLIEKCFGKKFHFIFQNFMDFVQEIEEYINNPNELIFSIKLARNLYNFRELKNKYDQLKSYEKSSKFEKFIDSVKFFFSIFKNKILSIYTKFKHGEYSLNVFSIDIKMILKLVLTKVRENFGLILNTIFTYGNKILNKLDL